MVAKFTMLIVIIHEWNTCTICITIVWGSLTDDIANLQVYMHAGATKLVWLACARNNWRNDYMSDLGFVKDKKENAKMFYQKTALARAVAIMFLSQENPQFSGSRLATSPSCRGTVSHPYI